MQSDQRQSIFRKDTQLYSKLEKPYKTVRALFLFSFLIVFKDSVVIFNFCCYVLSLIKSKFGNNRLIQASGLNGPIPPGIAFLENLTDLSVSIFYVTGINHFQMELHLNYFVLC